MRCSDLRMTHPLVTEQFLKLDKLLIEAVQNNELQVQLSPFETYRSPERQSQLYQIGRTMPGKIVTKAKPWQSAHQFGLAVDFVPRVRKLTKSASSLAWDWDAASDRDWSILASLAVECGLSCPVVWDLPHVEATDVWADFRTIITYREGPTEVIPFPGSER